MVGKDIPYSPLLFLYTLLYIRNGLCTFAQNDLIMANKKNRNSRKHRGHDMLVLGNDGNLYPLGGLLSTLQSGSGGGVLGGAASLASNAISGGMSTGVGSAMQTLGGIASNIPGIGGVIGAGVNVLGGVVNKAFGSKINEEFVADTKQNIAENTARQFDSSSIDSVLSQQSDFQDMNLVNKNDVGKDGWFSNKAKNLAKRLNKQIKFSNAYNRDKLSTAFSNAGEAENLGLLANFAAYGGQLFKNGGGIHIKKANRGKFTEYCGGKVTSECIARGKHSSSPAVRKRATFADNARKWHADGGILDRSFIEGMNVKLGRTPSGYPSEKGLEIVSPEFDILLGGGKLLQSTGKGITKGISKIIDNNTIPTNTFDKVVEKIDNVSKYADSKLHAPIRKVLDKGSRYLSEKLTPESDVIGKTVRRAWNGYRNMEENGQLPSIFQIGAQLMNNKDNRKAFGGSLSTHGSDFTNGITIVGNGGTHEQNPNEGVQMGVDQDGVPNLVEEGEVVFNNYVFSNRLKVPKKDMKKFKLKGKTFADAAKNLQKESEERPNDPISKRGLEASMGRLAGIQEGVRERKNGNKFAEGGPYKTYRNYESIDDNWYTSTYMNFVNSLKEGDKSSRAWLDRINSGEFGSVGGNTFTDISDIQRLATDRKKGPVHNAMSKAAELYKTESEIPSNITMDRLEGTPIGSIAPESKWRRENTPQPTEPKQHRMEGEQRLSPTWMRYAPVVGSAFSVLSDMFGNTNRPDYGPSDYINEAIKPIKPIGARTINNYLTYKPLDTDYMTNKLNANRAAQRRGILNTSGGNRATAMAGLIASDYNYGNQLGDLTRQAEMYNEQQRQQVQAFNRGTNQFNAEALTKADAANANIQQQQNELRLKQRLAQAQMRDTANVRSSQARSSNLTNLLDNLGAVGQENFARNMIASNPALYHDLSSKGGVEYKGKNKKKRGGRLTYGW